MPVETIVPSPTNSITTEPTLPAISGDINAVGEASIPD